MWRLVGWWNVTCDRVWDEESAVAMGQFTRDDEDSDTRTTNTTCRAGASPGVVTL